MAEIEERESVGDDGSIKKSRFIRASRIRIEHKDGTIEEISDLPADFEVSQNDDDILRHGRLLGSFWRLPDYLFEILHRRVREVGIGNDLLPRSIALLSEHGETFITFGDISVFLMNQRSLKVCL